MTPRSRALVPHLLGWGVPLGLLLLTVGPPVLLWGRLPARVADHWGLASDVPNGSHPKTIAVGIAAGLSLVGVALVVYWARRQHRGAYPTVALFLGLLLAGLGAALALNITYTNLDLMSWHNARLGVAQLSLLKIGPLTLAIAGTALARRVGLGGVTSSAVSSELAPRLGLADSERALWLGGARSRWAPPVAGVGLSVGLVLWLGLGWLPAIGLCCVAIAIGWFSSVLVSASADGVAVRYGPLRWPVTRIPLRRIVRAQATDVRTTSWGYRGSLALFGAAAVIVRSGTALRLQLMGDKGFVVTVDDAATGAALVNDELARQRR
ncbi:MAG: hypothetical protein JO100_12180 [Pseudonocardia sp.]|nr:hypothetical protein [Pseudonocardia sp.]